MQLVAGPKVMSARAIISAATSFGLVPVPLNLLQDKDRSRPRREHVCATAGEALGHEAMAKAYEHDRFSDDYRRKAIDLSERTIAGLEVAVAAAPVPRVQIMGPMEAPKARLAERRGRGERVTAAGSRKPARSKGSSGARKSAATST